MTFLAAGAEFLFLTFELESVMGTILGKLIYESECTGCKFNPKSEEMIEMISTTWGKMQINLYVKLNDTV